jgi:hypothetical protein
LLADYVRASKDNNATMQALKAYMAQNIGKNDNAVNHKNTYTENRQVVEVFPFSSVFCIQILLRTHVGPLTVSSR